MIGKYSGFGVRTLWGAAMILFTMFLPAMLAAQGADDSRFHWELGASGSYTKQYDVPLPQGELGSYGLDGVYSFRELSHDAMTRTAASRAVLPKSWVAVAGQIGPSYPDGSDVFITRMQGAWLATPTLGFGGMFALNQESRNTRISGTLEQMKLETNEYTYGVFLDIYASPGVMLRELIGIGKWEYRFGGDLIGDVSVVRYEHQLVATGGEDVGYMHELLLTSYEDGYTRAAFNHCIEVAPSTFYSLIPQLHLNALFPRHAEAVFSFGIGFGVQFNFTPRMFLQATPVYYHERDDSYGEEFDFQARLGVRF